MLGMLDDDMFDEMFELFAVPEVARSDEERDGEEVNDDDDGDSCLRIPDPLLFVLSINFLISESRDLLVIVVLRLEGFDSGDELAS